MKKLGLIGRNISYSFSKPYFEEKFRKEKISNYSYDVFDLNEISQVKDLMRIPSLKGFNVTIPYKQVIIPFLDELSEAASQIGAVNTVVKHEDKWIGHNTDVIGFEDSLKDLLNGEKPNRSLLLGTGGAALAVGFVLDRLKIEPIQVSRNKKNRNLVYSDLTADHFFDQTLVVNCTPLGTFPKVNDCPEIPYEFIHSNCFAHDLVYNPKLTLFMEKCTAQGAKTKNGLEMLHGQAEAAWSLWTETE